MNALHSMKQANGGKTLRVVTGQGGSPSDNCIVVEVADFGADVRGKLFAAFCNTKAHGIGIAPSISRSIVEACLREIWASANNGATFTIRPPSLAQGGS